MNKEGALLPRPKLHRRGGEIMVKRFDTLATTLSFYSANAGYGIGRYRFRTRLSLVVEDDELLTLYLAHFL